jgi:hypothetical protein
MLLPLIEKESCGSGCSDFGTVSDPNPLYCTVGCVDFDTVARVPLNVVVYPKKVGKMTSKFV